jgi:hypothetical protein
MIANLLVLRPPIAINMGIEKGRNGLYLSRREFSSKAMINMYTHKSRQCSGKFALVGHNTPG